MTSSRVCSHPKCAARIAPSRVFCRGHWFQLPKPLRDAIWDAYRRRDRRDSIKNIRAAVGWHLKAGKQDTPA